ncbi:MULTISPECIES: homoserine kinase [Leuconostoc]|uniref:Homoserine kinase n=2 Tax=Leuconostoc kimchii TaxID=136609 RepID=D5T4P7_LEUKI|nr:MULTISPECIES: homoserine kinase [Leuconostoc]ADG41518.1 homoserine kinase [Leuconostoc kimchii IMSNU 11154]AEJ30562.1 homoserine kinase [Leuconostoc sp. C2]QBR47680.1 homoserine kinase [Leuconostoc kimchii]
MIVIKVPATSANIGPGFDSLGVALQLYLTLEIHEKTSHWIVDHDFNDDMPHDENHFIVQKALLLAPQLTPHHIIVKSDIPLARGLGSSSSALLAGLAMANVINHLELSDDALLSFATRLEGHPDNVAPALFGGGVSAYYDGSKVYHAPLKIPKNVDFVTFIPNYELLTSEARTALPATLPFKQSVAASAISNTLIAALNADHFDTASSLIEQDQFHELARSALVPQLAVIRQIAHQLGITGTYLSGAGPTVITIVPKNRATTLLTALTAANLPGNLYRLEQDTNGLTITKEEEL